MLPPPAEPKFTLPGLAFAYLINSERLFTGSEGWTAGTSGTRTTSEEGEVLFHVVGDLGKRVGRDDQRRGAVDAQRVAIGRCLRRAVHAEHAADAGDVLHHHRLAELGRHALRER